MPNFLKTQKFQHNVPNQFSVLIHCLVCFLITISQLMSALPILAAFPASENYRLDEWTIGAGGSERTSSENYSSESLLDPAAAEFGKSTNYAVGPGQLFVQMANVPPAPAITNPDQWYNKLHLVIDPGDNPSDAQFAVAVSGDNFQTLSYIKADNTLGSTIDAADWRSFAAWNSTTGIDVIGLEPETEYSFRVKAEQGNFTESPWGPVGTGTTSALQISFDIDVSASDQDTDDPYLVSIGELNPGSVITAEEKIWIDFDTNAEGGGVVFVAGTNNGLKSNHTGHTIPGKNGDLSGQAEGYGLQTSSITQDSGGPFTADSPFNGSGNTVGAVGTELIPLNTSLSPIAGARSSQEVKTIINSLTNSANDYTDVLTLVAAGTF